MVCPISNEWGWGKSHEGVERELMKRWNSRIYDATHVSEAVPALDALAWSRETGTGSYLIEGFYRSRARGAKG